MRGLAERWSEIVELPVKADVGGYPSLRRGNTGIRFVPHSDFFLSSEHGKILIL
ncbi:MAG: hypothetical protein ACRERD_17290 [Candidatus Binatia bacterium]